VNLAERRVRFEYGDDFDPAWNSRFPEFACAANGISLIMPYAEPYFVASVRKALPQLDDEALRVQTEGYLRQELSHHRQHKRFNELIERRYPKVRRIERWMARAYGWLGRSRSLRFNVAFAAGSETIAYSLARWSEKHLGQLFAGAEPRAATLFLWHLAEEIEHKTAAFDVFEAIDGSRRRYAWASIVSLTLLFWFTWASALAMLAGERRLRYPITWFRLLRWSISLAFEILPTQLVSALPGHHPRSLVDPIYLPTWLGHFDPATGTLPVWEDAAA
jgi:predicted metal-dependent hydrolase